MQRYSISPREIVDSFWRNRSIIASLVMRDFIGRYRGSMIGIVWSLFHPILMLTVYTFVFGFILKSKWGVGSDSKTEFALMVFAGLLVFHLFSDCVNRAPSIVLTHPNYVKKVVFPLEVLSWVMLGSALFHLVVSLAVWLIFCFLVMGGIQATTLLFPVVLLPIVLLTMGLSWCLASLGVYLRDVSHVVSVATTALLFLSPVFYPLSALPEEYRGVLSFNPLTLAIEHVRGVLIWGRIPDPGIFATYLGISALVAWLGFAWFQKTRKGFADVI